MGQRSFISFQKFTIFSCLTFSTLFYSVVQANETPVITDLHRSEVDSSEIHDKELSRSPTFDFRIRPLGLLFEIPGFESNILIGPRFEFGPTIHYFQGENDVRGSSVHAWEFGFKATYLIYLNAYRQGVYLSTAAYEYLTRVSQSLPTGASAQTSNFYTPGFTVTAGYQWQLGFFQTDSFTLRLGGGLGYKQEHIETVQAVGQNYPIGVRERLDPTLEFTVGVSL